MFSNTKWLFHHFRGFISGEHVQRYLYKSVIPQLERGIPETSTVLDTRDPAVKPRDDETTRMTKKWAWFVLLYFLSLLIIGSIEFFLHSFIAFLTKI